VLLPADVRCDAVEELQRQVQNDQDRELEASLHGDRFSNPNAT